MFDLVKVKLKLVVHPCEDEERVYMLHITFVGHYFSLKKLNKKFSLIDHFEEKPLLMDFFKNVFY